MQVFLSYAESDESLAKKVTEGLEGAGLKVWYDRREILPGENWADKVGRALKESKAMVVLLTPAALRSPNVRRNIEFALGDRTYSHRLIPVIVGAPEKLPQKEMPWILNSLQVVNLPERGSQEEKFKQIATLLAAA
ncbi:MAG: hypothetical protein QOC61_1369 [Acidobacteriota bacterium]|jgi:hypothetical protein|nr:hypothetical protein [Acidobacteriota bacterium]MDT5262365.1 hypothetical protein [Acidobacteriota bacterium]MDT7777923.1 hypothetical protein [Acidobacteriota bacterium]